VVLQGKTVGERIKMRRSQLGLSQTELSQRAGVLQQSISATENQPKKLRRSSLVRVAEVLGCEPSELDPHFQAETSDDTADDGTAPKSSRRSSARGTSERMSPSFAALLDKLSEGLESKLGFRPNHEQAVRYILKIYDTENEFGTR
jgi:transcriptional regulator with XRE-family HTH domain